MTKRGARIDFAAAMEATEQKSDAFTEDRFTRAQRTVAERPSALSPAVPAATADAAAAPVRQAQLEPSAPSAATQAFVDVASMQIGSTYRVPLHLIDPNPLSPRHFYRNTRVDATATSLEKNGQRVAVNGYVKPEGRVGLIEGGTRLKAAKAAGQEFLEVKIEQAPKDELDLYNRAVAFHEERSDHTALDTAMLMAKLVASGAVQSQDELCERILVNGERPSKSSVSMHMRVATTIPERLLRAMSEHETTSGIRTAYAITGLFKAERFKDDPDAALQAADDLVREIIEREVSGRAMSVKEIEDQVKARSEGPRTRDRADAIKVRFGEANGAIKVFASRGQLDFSIRGLPADKLDQLKAHIEAVCAGRVQIAED